MSNNQYVCLHITKTAGGTLKRSLQSADDLNVEFVYNAVDREKLAERDLTGVNLIYGHAMYGIHEEIGFAENPKYMCFMRHPLSRTISHYYHLRNVDKSPVGDKIRQSEDINDFFENHHHWEFSNLMTRVVSGVGVARGADEDEILEHARENLRKHFSFVGFQEFFSFSMRAFSRALKNDLPQEKDINVGRYDISTITQKTLDHITETNKQDLALYKQALRRFL